MSDYKRSTGTKRLRGSLDASDHRPRQRSRPDHDQTTTIDHDHDDEFTNTAETMTDDKGLVSREGMRDLRTLPGHADEFTNTAETTNKKTTTTDEGHAKTTTRQERAELGAMAPCEACGAEVFADYSHLCLQCGLRLPLTPTDSSPY